MSTTHAVCLVTLLVLQSVCLCVSDESMKDFLLLRELENTGRFMAPMKQLHTVPMTTELQPEPSFPLTTKAHLPGICSSVFSKGAMGYHPMPDSCNQYIHCDKAGNGHIETCAVGTFFSATQCVRAESVKCPYDPCRKKPHSYKYSDAQTCYGFYRCKNGASQPESCPPGFSFNGVAQNCVPDFMCHQNSDIQHPCSGGTTLPFPGQPGMFYLWDGRKSFTEMHCPRGLWYNPKLCTCDWVIPGQLPGGKHGCGPMFHFGYNGNFLEEYNQAPQAPNTAVSIYKNSAQFDKGGHILIWMMNHIDMDSEWALCFEFMTSHSQGEVALLSNDWRKVAFTYKITYIPSKHIVVAYFRMKDGTVAEMITYGAEPDRPHFVRMAKLGAIMKMRVDNMAPATVAIDAGVASAPTPMVIGSAKGCEGLQGFFDELKFFRCVPELFFSDY